MNLSRILCGVSAWLILAFACQAAEYQGRVIGVADGDTITVLDGQRVQHKVRLAGIDAPEKAQPYGDASKRSLSDLVNNKQVTVITDKTDRYGREVGKVLIEGRDANLQQVHRGMAWVYVRYLSELVAQDRQLYRDAELEARTARRGLWSMPSPTPPWDYRHRDSGTPK